MRTYSAKFQGLTTNHCALIYRPLLDAPAGLHYGFLYFIEGEWQVLHLLKYGPPQFVSLEEFAAGQNCDVDSMKLIDVDETQKRIQTALKSHSTYSLVLNNCEDFARYVFNGQRWSYQVILPALAGLLLCFLLPSK